MDNCITKPCTRCGIPKPLTTEYFYRSKNQSSGFSPRCKDCISEQHGHKRRVTTKCAEGFRECVECKRTLPETSEYFWSCNGVFRRQCVECARKLQNDKRVASGFPAFKPALTGNLKKARLRETRIARYYRRKANGTLPKAKPKKVYEAKRRAKARNLPCDWNMQKWEQCLKFWDYKCCVCGQSESETHIIAQDHWIAIKDNRVDNPGTVATNIVPLCHARRGLQTKPGCNNTKCNLDAKKWLLDFYPPAEAQAILDRIEEYFQLVGS